jgi:hypothetical protein
LAEYVEHPTLGRLEVLDDSDPSLLTVKSASGGTLKIGKRVVGWKVDAPAKPEPGRRDAGAPTTTEQRRSHMESKTIEFKMERETKNTVRYEEETTGQPPAVGTLYVQKWALGSPAPQTLKVTIESGE